MNRDVKKVINNNNLGIAEKKYNLPPGSNTNQLIALLVSEFPALQDILGIFFFLSSSFHSFSSNSLFSFHLFIFLLFLFLNDYFSKESLGSESRVYRKRNKCSFEGRRRSSCHSSHQWWMYVKRIKGIKGIK